MKPDDVIGWALNQHDIKSTVCLFSGGHDSLTATHYVMENYAHLSPEVVHIDTGIGIPETQQFVIDTCERYGWPLSIYRAVNNVKADGAPDPMIYDDIVLQNGFPGPGAHRIMYSKLKQRQVRRVTRDRKRKHSDRVMFVSGVRKEESTRRMGTTEYIQRDGAQVWVAPLLDFTGSDQKQYMNEHDLPRNPVKDKLCVSGECLCGAFAHEGELKEIEFWYLDTGKRIRELERRVTEAGHKGGWEKSRWKRDAKVEKAGPMCATCDARYDASVGD